MKRSKKIASVLLIVLVIIQFFQPRRNRSDIISQADIASTLNVPVIVHNILNNACYDCHSNNTNYPWYSNVQPFGWLLSKHIRNAKAELNFNEFGTYTKRRQISKLDGIANSIEDGSMPLSSYKLLHKKARLSKEDKALIIDWVERIKDSLRMNN